MLAGFVACLVSMPSMISAHEHEGNRHEHKHYKRHHKEEREGDEEEMIRRMPVRDRIVEEDVLDSRSGREGGLRDEDEMIMKVT